MAKPRGMPKRKARSPAKTVEWSEADQAYIGRCPELFSGGVHGTDKAKVFKELSQAVDEWMAKDQAEPKRKGGRTHESIGISAEPAYRERVDARAAELKMNRSAYVRYCIDKDLAEGGSISITPTGKQGRKTV
jgi:predicted RNase H-like HicB family nuclease